MSGGERLPLLLIGSTVLAAAALLILGGPRARVWITPRIERVWVVSAALGDQVASAAPRQAVQGTPVTLYAIVQARPWGADTSQLYGPVDRVVLEPEGEPVTVEEWNRWWLPLAILWFKVEPAYPFENAEFDPSFGPDQIPYTDHYQVSWGFGFSHAADIRPSGDAYPDWTTGTMRFSARAVIRSARERILQSAAAPAAEGVGAATLAERPHRVTIRAGDDAFGHFQGFAGLPYVPIESPQPPGEHPAERYMGGTVLAFWLQAQRLAGAYDGILVNWEQLPNIAELVIEDMFLARDGIYYHTDDPRRPVTFDEVRAGDLLTIEDHVGVLYEDRGPGGAGDGVLSRWDRLLEAYFEPLRETAAGDAFIEGVTVYRLGVQENR